MRDAAPDRRRLADVGDVAEQHRHISSRGHHGAAEVVNGLRPAERADGPLDRALRDDAARGVHVRFLDRVHHLVEADAPRRHALGIELHLELAEIAAEPLDGRDARHGQEPVVHLELGEIPQRHQVRRAGVGFEREFEDLVETAGQAGDQRRVGAGRKLAGDLRDPLGDELPRAVVVGARLELDRDLRDAELRVRSHPPHVRQPGERDLERNGDRRLELLGAHGRVLRDDVEHRRRQIGEDIPPQILHPERADRRSGRDQQRRQERRVKRLANQPANHVRASVSIVLGLALFGLRLEQERAIDDDRLAGAQPGQHFDFAAEIAAAADAADLEMVRVLGQEHAPLVANTLHRRDRDASGWRRRSRRPAAWRVADMPGRSRLPLFFTSIRTGTVRDSRSTCRPTIVTVPSKVLSGKRGKRQPRRRHPAECEPRRARTREPSATALRGCRCGTPARPGRASDRRPPRAR